MSKVLWKSFLAGTAVSAATLAVCAVAVAQITEPADKTGKFAPAQPLTAEATEADPVPGATVAPPAPAAELPAPHSDGVASTPTAPVTPVEVAGAPPAPELPAPATAQEVLEPVNSDTTGSDSEPMAQVTSVSQLSDVQPTDWAFQALQNLVERYGCIAGYPDGTFRGNRAMTRYEFAAGLNACLERIVQLIGTTNTSNLATKQDLAVLQRLAEEFQAELATLRGRADTLEARTAELEANQFSTTTKLNGIITFSALDTFSGRGDRQAVLQHQTFLSLSTSFTGRDLLSTSLLANTAAIPNLDPTNNGRDVGSTREGLTTWAFGGNTGNAVIIGNLEYIFPILDSKDRQLYVTIAPYNGFNTSRFLLPISNLTWEGYSLGSGAVSAFAQRSPMYRLGGGQGLLVNYNTGPWRLTGFYLASQGFKPTPGAGFFNGDYLAGAQLNYTSSRLAVALAYQNNYFGPGRFAFNSQYTYGPDSPGFVGTALANRFDNAGVFFDKDVAVISNTYGAQAYYQLGPKLIFGGFVSKISARLIGRGDADIWTYAVNFSFPDLGKRGNLGGLIVGVEPALTGLRVGDRFVGGFKRDTSLHIEAFYKYQVTDNVSITPGVIWIGAPNQDADNEDIVVGLIRTTFSF